MSAVIEFTSDAFTMEREKLMGLQAAGHGFLTGLARHAVAQKFEALVTSGAEAEDFRRLILANRNDAQIAAFGLRELGRVAQTGTLHVPNPMLARQAYLRERYGRARWSLTGVIHTTASTSIMSGLIAQLQAPLMDWDAIICTSQAVRRMVLNLLEGDERYQEQLFGQKSGRVPNLPVIPLGVDTQALAFSPLQKAEARQSLGIQAEAIVALFLGRLSVHAKAHPAPFYIAAQAESARRPIVILECGWMANEQIKEMFERARHTLAPDVRFITLDGRLAPERARAWAAGDIFCSFSDNIQETFGLTPVEAMAAGMPVLCSDWNGYRDTVRHRIDGIMVPTIAAAPGAGHDLAAGLGAGLLTYDEYLLHASASVAVDVEGAVAAFAALAENSGLRASMGQAGRQRAVELFDWRVIIAAYEDLWRELSARRSKAAQAPGNLAARMPPHQPDPFSAFSHYPSWHLSGSTLVGPGRLLGRADMLGALPSNHYPGSAWRKNGLVAALTQAVEAGGEQSAESLAGRLGSPLSPQMQRTILQLAKFGVFQLRQS